MSNKFKIGDNVTVDIPYDETFCYPFDLSFYEGKSGVVVKYSDNFYHVNFNGNIIGLLENMLRLNETKLIEEQFLRELLIKNREVLLGNRKAIDESLKLIEILLNK